jgi:hypothetical protein
MSVVEHYWSPELGEVPMTGRYMASKVCVGFVTVAFVMACSGLVEQTATPVPAASGAFEMTPSGQAAEIKTTVETGRLEIFWGPPEQGDMVWAEGTRMQYESETGPYGTWVMDARPGPYQIRLRDGFNHRTVTISGDVVVEPGRYVWCHAFEADPSTGAPYNLDFCRRGEWPGQVDRST